MPAEFDSSSMQEGLGRFGAKAIAAAKLAVDQFGEGVVLASAQQMCPVKTGFLQGSATSTPSEIEEGRITKVIGFNAEYAAAVHENLEASHPVGQAKYLETALREDGPKMGEYVSRAVKEAGGGEGGEE